MILSDRFSRALTYSAQKHRMQRRKGTTIPYVSHVLGVASLALEHGANEDQAIAALLHDVIEDAKDGRRARREILAKFGPGVARIVEGCTDTDVQPKPPWRERKEAYIAHLCEAPAEVRLVSAADKLHNARAILADHRQIGEKVWSRFNGGRDGTLWYYRELVKAFRKAGSSPLIEELARTVRAIERAARRDPRTRRLDRRTRVRAPKG